MLIQHLFITDVMFFIYIYVIFIKKIIKNSKYLLTKKYFKDFYLENTPLFKLIIQIA